MDNKNVACISSHGEYTTYDLSNEQLNDLWNNKSHIVSYCDRPEFWENSRILCESRRICN